MFGELLPIVLPAASLLLALPFGLRSRAPNRKVRAVYLLHDSGDPLAMVASDFLPPIPARELEPLLGTIRDFVETSMPASRGHKITSMRFGEEALVAVRGRHVSACAIFRGPAGASIRRDLVRFVREFEGQNGEHLARWEDATRLAEDASDALGAILSGAREASVISAGPIAATA